MLMSGATVKASVVMLKYRTTFREKNLVEQIEKWDVFRFS